MFDRRSFSFITIIHKYYCPDMFWEVEQKEKVMGERMKTAAKWLRKEGVPLERKKESELPGVQKEKGKGKGERGRIC